MDGDKRLFCRNFFSLNAARRWSDSEGRALESPQFRAIEDCPGFAAELDPRVRLSVLRLRLAPPVRQHHLELLQDAKDQHHVRA